MHCEADMDRRCTGKAPPRFNSTGMRYGFTPSMTVVLEALDMASLHSYGGSCVHFILLGFTR